MVLAGLEERARVVVVHALGDVDVHAADPVHDLAEALEVDENRVGDVDAEHLVDGLGHQRRPAGHVGGVDLPAAVTRDRGAGVARDVEDRPLVQLRVDREHVQRVTTRSAHAGPQVAPDQKEELEAARVRPGSSRPTKRCTLMTGVFPDANGSRMPWSHAVVRPDERERAQRRSPITAPRAGRVRPSAADVPAAACVAAVAAELPRA